MSFKRQNEIEVKFQEATKNKPESTSLKVRPGFENKKLESKGSIFDTRLFKGGAKIGFELVIHVI